MRAADSEKHMARIERARGAGGAGGSAYALCIEQKQERLASIPSKQKLTLPGRRFVRSPFNALCGIFSRPSISLSRRADTFSAFASILAFASLRAATMPTIPGIFSVPARLPRSCAPPSMIFVSLTPCGHREVRRPWVRGTYEPRGRAYRYSLP